MFKTINLSSLSLSKEDYLKLGISPDLHNILISIDQSLTDTTAHDLSNKIEDISNFISLISSGAITKDDTQFVEQASDSMKFIESHLEILLEAYRQVQKDNEIAS